MRASYENVIIVTRKTELDDLVARFNTRAQAKFYLEQAGHSFEPIQIAHETHQAVLAKVKRAVPITIKSQVIHRDIVPQFTFGEDDLVIAVGQDGLVSNTAKYLSGQPILGVNPDPGRFDGVLLPFTEATFERSLKATLQGDAQTKQVTLAKAELADGQTLLAFNDFSSARDHTSRRAIRSRSTTSRKSSPQAASSFRQVPVPPAGCSRCTPVRPGSSKRWAVTSCRHRTAAASTGMPNSSFIPSENRFRALLRKRRSCTACLATRRR